ncbi:MAG TPA: efflux RND transporter periplasmic adaptor subunit [Steroidobacteraceae bacterium]|jgi:RND family efflux transporter MFP subunit|nr:efflux RND transporter periplasmic adaptor subunit [Steroidobacteraceae bacterium]
MNHSIPPTGTPAHTRGIARWSAVAAVLGAAVVAWALFASHRAGAKLKEATEAQALITVATVKPEPLSDSGVLSLPGTVQANYDAPIYARTNGYLKKWYVDIGTPVKAGQVLAEIDAPEIDQQLRQAEADLANAQANQKISQITAERWRGLRDTDSVSKQEADEKISLAATADAQVQAAQANLQRLRELSGFKKIVAPFDGVVTARNTDVGQLINAGGSGPELFRIADTRKLRIYVRVPQTYAAMMQPDLEAQVVFPDRPGMTFTAKLERTSNALDASSRTLLAQLIVDNSKNELLPGGYAEVDFKLDGSTASSFKLPANVLLFRGEGTQVATVDAHDRIVLKPVTIGRDYGSDIEIVQGLMPDDDVVLSPPDSLTDHAQVRVSRPDENKEVAKL